MTQGKYKEGDTFKATLRVFRVDDYNHVYLSVEELDSERGSGHLGEYFTFDELDEAFDPNYEERKRLKRMKELQEELNALKEEEGKDNE